MMTELQALFGGGQAFMEPLRCLSSSCSSAGLLAPWRLHSSTNLHLAPRVRCGISMRLRRTVSAILDQDLRTVLELASDAELHELSNILYGQSLLSPLLKSMTRGDGSHKKLEQELEGRDALVDRLESRFLYLGADAKETLRGWRPTYRDILLCVRAKLSVCCSTKLSTEDLEVEIFLHLLQQNTRGDLEFSLQSPWKHQLLGNAEKVDPMTQYSENWHVALKLGGGEFLKVLLKGGSVFSILFFQNTVARKLGGRVLVQTARYQVAKEVLKKGGQAAASNLQARVAVLAARQGLAGAASCYATLQRTSMLFGPLFVYFELMGGPRPSKADQLDISMLKLVIPLQA
eukprot:c19856_g1_i1 orf=174-1211(+)